MKLKLKPLKETETYHRFVCRDDDNFTALYLKKTAVAEEGINPNNGLVVDIKEDTK